MTEFAKVDVKDISSEVPRTTFLEEEIEQLADSILESRGILKPLIVKQTGIESFVVLDGHLEYFASVRAREKNPRQGEMVNAFVIIEKDEAAARKQIKVLNGSGKVSTSGGGTVQPPTSKSSGDSNWISSFETRLSEIREELFQTKRDHENRFAQLEKQLHQNKGDLLDFLNNSKEQDLMVELSRYGLVKGKVEAICSARSQKQNRKFDSYQDVVKTTKGFGAEGMVRLIDAWTNTNRS